MGQSSTPAKLPEELGMHLILRHSPSQLFCSLEEYINHINKSGWDYNCLEHLGQKG
jgi:hypothetical protein